MTYEIDRWILPEMESVIDCRRQVFERRKASSQQADHLESLSQRVQARGRIRPGSLPNPPVESMSPQEFDRVVEELEGELSQIQATEDQIQGCGEEIQRLEHRRKMILVCLVCLILVAAIWLVATLR